MDLKARNFHRDIAYFYVGLIIAFAFSGIFLNHRSSWFPKNYYYEELPVSIQPPSSGKEIDEAFVAGLSKAWDLESKYQGFRSRGNELRISYEGIQYSIDLETGQGISERYFQVPFLAQFTTLHQETNPAWIWYSDIFGIAMLTLAFTGMFIEKGKFSFRARGWKFASLGILFPLIFLFLIS